MSVHYEDASIVVHHGDCLDVLRGLPDASVDAICTDPPYSLSFMSREWDSHATPLAFQSWCETWAVECLRVLKPGGHLLAFGGTRTSHRLTCGIEDAGFEIRDSIGSGAGQLAWVYGSGFPKGSRVNRDERFCQCAASADTSSHTSPETQPDVRTHTEADAARAEGGARSAESASRALPDSPDGYRPEYGSGGAPPRLAGAADLASAQPREGALARSHSVALADGPDDGSSHTPYRAPRIARPSSQGCDPLADSQPSESTHTQANTSPADISESGCHTPGIAQGLSCSNSTGFPVCTRCHKPNADGWNVAMKPSWEPIVVARKPLAAGTVAANVLRYGTGALNIDATRIGREPGDRTEYGRGRHLPHANTSVSMGKFAEVTPYVPNGAGRWPANVVLDGRAAASLDTQSGDRPGFSGGGTSGAGFRSEYVGGTDKGWTNDDPTYFGDSGGASRFFLVAADDPLPIDTLSDRFRYVAKADASERPFYFTPSCECEDACPTTSPARATDATTARGSSSTSKHGNATTGDPCPTDIRSTTSTATNSTTTPPTSWPSRQPSTSESTEGASSETASGGSHVGSASSSSTSVQTIGTSALRDGPSTDAASRVTSRGWSATSVCGRCGAPPRRESHSTVKPLDLMRWLVRLVTPPMTPEGLPGLVLDPFAGSGTTVEACILEGFRCIAIEREAEYLPLIEARVTRQRDPVRHIELTGGDLGLFDLGETT